MGVIDPRPAAGRPSRDPRHLTFSADRPGTKVAAVGISISDLRGAQPADATLQNLLGVLGAKLELCSRLPIFEYEAGNEGHEAAAAAFRRLADVERQSFNELLASLRRHLEELSVATEPPKRTPGPGMTTGARR
jgi:hypothetical protein